MNRQVDIEVEQALRDHLTTGPTDWQALHPWMDEYRIRYSDIATLALRNDWYWHRNPFRLSTTPLYGTPRWDAVTRGRG